MFFDFCPTPPPPHHFSNRPSLNCWDSFGYPCAFYPYVIQVFYDRYFRFVSLVTKKAHMPVSGFQRKAPDFRLHLARKRSLHWLSISSSSKLRQTTLKNACIRQASCRRYCGFSWWRSWIQAWQVLREISSPIARGSADIPCNRGNSVRCCVDSNQTYVSWINISLPLCGNDRPILSKVSQYQDA